MSPEGRLSGGEGVRAIPKEEDPRVTVLRMIESDPLGVDARVRRMVQSRALFVNQEKATVLAMSRLALDAASYAGHPSLEEWVDLAVEVTLGALMDRQREEESQGSPPEDDQDERFYKLLARRLDIPPTAARLACIVLNELPDAQRRIFHAIAYYGTDAATWCRRSGTRLEEAQDTLRQVATVVREAIRRKGESRGRGRGDRARAPE